MSNHKAHRCGRRGDGDERRRAAILISAGSLVAFALAAAAPIWTVSSREDIEFQSGPQRLITLRNGPLWKADLIDNRDFQRQNRIQLGLLACVVAIGGLVVYLLIVPNPRLDPVGDYEEKADGSMPDGRAPPGDPSQVL